VRSQEREGEGSVEESPKRRGSGVKINFGGGLVRTV
jgi:hypothetical protein